MIKRAPLSQNQAGVYFDYINNPDSTNYNTPLFAKLGEEIDTDRVIDALKMTLKAFPSINIRVKYDSDGKLIQEADTDGEIPVRVFEMSAEEFEKIKGSLTRRFELSEEAPLRVEFYRTPGGDYLLLDLHHIIFDGSAFFALQREFEKAYSGQPVTPESLTGFDIAQREAALIGGEEYIGAKAWFDNLLCSVDAGCVPDRDVFSDEPEEGVLNFDFDLDEAEFRRVKEKGKTSTTGFFTSVMGFVTAEFCCRSDSVINTLFSDRAGEKKEVVSMLVKTLPFVTEFSRETKTEELLAAQYEQLSGSRRNCLYPFSEIAAAHDVGNNFAFTYQGKLEDFILLNKPLIGLVRLDDRTRIEQTPFILLVHLRENGKYRVSVRYRKDQYSDTFAENFARTYIQAVRGFMKCEYLRDITLCDSAELEGLAAVNKTERPYPSDKTVVDLFREQAKKTPDNTCIVFRDKKYTYRQVDELTDRLARHLTAMGIGKETVVGVMLPKCEYMPISALGVLKAGGAYMPLDPSYPPERLRLMLDDSGAKLLITTPELDAAVTADLDLPKIMAEDIPGIDCDCELPTPSASDLAVLLYTSGSTGTPKGVMWEHGNIVVLISWEVRYFDMDESSKTAAYASFGFDAHIYDFYPVLICGGELHIIPEEIRLDLSALREHYNKVGITNATLTTQVGRQFALLGGHTSLRHLTVAGEKLTPLEPPTGFNLYNVYGPTEGSCATSAYKVESFCHDVPVGAPLDNLKLHIVDKNGNLLPVGAVGELWISGPHVTRGYLNRPEKTAEAYGKNPFCGEAGYERVYHTGDVVRLLGNGNLQFIGRRDSQVKIRGFRIELTEVEEVVRRCPGVKDATVAAFDDAAGGKLIAAYIVSDEEIPYSVISDFIRAEKPTYMVPAVVMRIDKIPLNQNQKVNKKALPKPERKAEDIAQPENDTQRDIFEIAAEVLGHRSFGINTSLYEAGLSSIGVIRINVLLSDKFGVAMKIADIKENDTVKKLEEFINGAEKQTESRVLPDYPISQTQNGIFVECAAAPGQTVYNMPLLLKVGNGVDSARLVEAVKKAINAHPYAKTTLFADENGEIRARRNDSSEPAAELVKGALPKPEELVRPFELIESTLYRAAVYDTPDDKYLFMDFHHIISDGASEAILLGDIEKAYAGEALTVEKYTGFDAALDEEKVRASERYAAAKAYYESVFSGCETECLPPKCPESGEHSAASLTRICSAKAQKVTDFCAKNSVSANAFFNAAFGFTLSRFTQVDDVVFTTIYNGRSDSRLASSLTMLVKTLPVLVKTEKDGEVAGLIRETGEQLIDSMANDIYSFAEISASFGIRSDIIFVYQGDNFTFDSLCGEKAQMIDVMPETAKAPITVNVYFRNGAVELAADYRRDIFSSALISELLSAFEKSVDEFMTKEKLSEISLLTDDAEAKLATINDTKRAFENVPAHALFERRAAEHPEKTAVVSTGRSLTFGELNSLANRIAHRLIALGVKKDSIVGMMLDRTADISVAELGILKAGGAFLGLLPSYPDERIDYCLTDAESEIVITAKELAEEKKALFAPGKAYKAVFIEDLTADGDESNPNLDITPDSLAYCIYTSGSTGKPKGVMIEHHNLVNFAQPADFTYRYFSGKEGGSVFLALSSITFDMSIFDNLNILLNGKTVVVASEQEIHNPGRLAELMISNGVDGLASTPSFVTNYIGIPEFRKAMKNVRTIVVGAEAFPAALYRELRSISPEMHIINGYGPTECTITCCSKDLTSEKNITIGGPAANVKFYVVDRFGNVLPPYGCGELIICGECVGRGYVKLPEKTAASFYRLRGIPAYHSGDTVRLNADGEMEFFGRIDNQVKLRGFRVELDEIENVLCSFESVRQSKVIVRNNGTEDYLAGFFTADTQVDLAALTEHLKSKLTYYMVPDVLLQLEKMPLTPSGKVDKKALPEIKKESKKKEGRRAPKKSLEERLCDLFKSILSCEEYYADDNFFEMGGTSLSASKATMQLMSQGIKVEYQDIFDHPTPEALAEFVESRKVNAPEVKEEESEEQSRTAELLEHNALQYAERVKREPLGDVLLTGAVGFLGVHVLRELIERNEGKIICLVRKGNYPDPETRLKNMLMYYFGSTYGELFGERISVADADITDGDLAEKLSSISFDTLINCAACVKHYAADDVIERINVHGVENLITLATAKKAKMIQISTTSVPGVHTEESYRQRVVMHENELFVVDSMDNKYCISKYNAELKMLEAVKNGMRGKIIRVGNLMGRYSDGEFQINFNTNAFLNALRGFATIGKSPVSHATDPMRFSPIDLTARAIVLLAGTNDIFTAFHADNRFGFDEMQLIEACNNCGIKITPVDDREYYADYYRMLGDDKVNSRLQGLVTNDRPDLHAVETDNCFTANILYRLGFSWPLIDTAYLERTIRSLMTLDYFEPDDIYEL